MDLYFLDKDFKLVKILDVFKNFAWHRKYYDTGNFSIEITIDEYKQLKESNAKYVCCNEFRETAKIETLDYISSSVSATTVILTGRFLENELANRVIKQTVIYYAKTEMIARDLVEKLCINSENPLFEGKLKLGKYNNLGTYRDWQKTGDDLELTLHELLKLDGLTYSIDYDYENDELVFNVWKGKDRRETQLENAWCVFSKDFENIQNDKYSTDETQYKNVAIVAGEGVGGNRVVVEVNQIKPGEERRELYVDARDLQQGEDMSEAEYKNNLIQRGQEKLQDANKVDVVEFKIDPDSNLIYGQDFDLGDDVTYKNEDLDIYVDNKIVEIAEVFEDGARTIEVVFGDDYNIKRW